MNTNVTYLARLIEFMRKHFPVRGPLRIDDLSPDIETMLSENWAIWRNLLLILRTTSELERLIGAKVPEAPIVDDILDDGIVVVRKPQPMSSLFVFSMIVTNLENFDALGLADQARSRVFMKDVFACLQTVINQQSLEVMKKVWEIKFPSSSGFGFNQQGLQNDQPLHRGAQNVFQQAHQPIFYPMSEVIKPITDGKLTYVSELIAQVTEMLVVRPSGTVAQSNS